MQPYINPIDELNKVKEQESLYSLCAQVRCGSHRTSDSVSIAEPLSVVANSTMRALLCRIIHHISRTPRNARIPGVAIFARACFAKGSSSHLPCQCSRLPISNVRLEDPRWDVNHLLDAIPIPRRVRTITICIRTFRAEHQPGNSMVVPRCKSTDNMMLDIQTPLHRTRCQLVGFRRATLLCKDTGNVPRAH